MERPFRSSGDGSRSAVAAPIDDGAVMVTMRHGRGGPWTVITDAPRDGREPMGPPPGYLALAGVSTCTLVTVAGLASRKGPAIDAMRIEMAIKVGSVRERLLVDAAVTERDRVRLERAAEYCPVAKIFTHGLIEIADRVEIDGAAAKDQMTLPDRVDTPVLPDGSVAAVWRGDTREWRDAPEGKVLEQEGEVTLHLESGPERRWALLGGHTSARWAPRPSPYAKGALAASTLMTLRALAGPLGIDAPTLRVEVRAISDPPAGGKRESQDRAGSASAQVVRWERVVRADARSGSSSAAVLRAMRLDPIYAYTLRRDLIASRELVAEAAEPAPVP